MERIAVTTENGTIFQHFGKTQVFTIADTENGKILSHKVVDTAGSGHSALGGFLKNAGVNTLICGGIGQGARDVLAENGIKLVSGASGDVLSAVEAYLSGNLADDPAGVCDHHHDENCGEPGEHRC